MTKEFIPNKRYGIDFAQKCYHVEVMPDRWVVVHANNEQQAKELARGAGHAIIAIEEYTHQRTSTYSGARSGNK